MATSLRFVSGTALTASHLTRLKFQTPPFRRLVTMATPYRVRVSPAQTGLLKCEQTAEAAEKASELLQKDVENHHVFFNNSGFHNHIVHHILSLFGTGAPPDALIKAYKGNDSYQRPAMDPRSDITISLSDWPAAKKHLGNEKNYPDFLLFYQREIERLGWKEALNEHLFKGDERADDLLRRMMAGFLHPLIQLMYGLEWEQPAIVATGLAQAAVHRDQLGGYLSKVEVRARENSEPMTSILELVEEARANEKLAKSAHFNDGNKIYDGVMVRAPEEAMELTSRVKIAPEELEERTAEMFHAAVVVAAGAAIHPPKEPRVDFFLMHHVNAAPIHLTINSQDWIPTQAKVRLLEWKIRMDIVQYIARGCPPLQLNLVEAYKPKDEILVSKISDLLPRFHPIPDDGHTIKLARAIHICHDLTDQYQGKAWVKIKDEEQWKKISYMVLDSAENPSGQRWTRSAGFDDAWKDIPDQK